MSASASSLQYGRRRPCAGPGASPVPGGSCYERRSRAPGHRSAEELAADVQARAPDIHLSTIYRNLDDLDDWASCAHAHLGHGPGTYHQATMAHGHFVCEECGVMVEALDELFRTLALRQAAVRIRHQSPPLCRARPLQRVSVSLLATVTVHPGWCSDLRCVVTSRD